MTYIAPTREQLFVLDHVVGMAELRASERFSSAEADMVEAIVDGAGRFAEGEFAPLNTVGDREGVKLFEGQVRMPAGFGEAYRAYVDNGWGSIAAPADFGGQGMPVSLATVAQECLGSANMAFALCPMLTVGAIEALTHHGSADQQAQYLPHLSSGNWTGTMNLTEPQAGSDVGALRTMATPVGDGSFKIKGTKIFITFGDHDMTENIVHLVLARTPGAPAGTKGISLFLVPKYRLDADGKPGAFNDVRPASVEHKLGIHASPTCVLSFGDDDDCIGHLIGAEGAGMRAMFTMMNNARLNVGLQGVQVAERASQQALAYARDRVQSARAGSGSHTSVAIIEHPDVRRMLLRSRALTQAIRALVYYAFGQLDRAALGDTEAARRLELLTPLAKAYGTDIGTEVASLNVQVHGGMGFIEETGAAQHYRDIRIAAIYEGTNGIQAADLVGRKLGLEGGATVARLLHDIRADAGHEVHLLRLAELVSEVVAWMHSHDSVDDRLAGSYPLLTMLSVATAGWLMARQEHVATAMLNAGEGDPTFLKNKIAAARYYCDVIVPEACGLAVAARAGAGALYALSDEELAA
ncbi:acyl-CoA dehydrogenase [Sphingobium subterraneum]|uniref:3-methylmercaptopropionyl-CoA dehydrogenase n=1 Tax=Sphingobium subterraneum TaxID=627688 RepID=A0A841IVI7_9SPHN|nr:acyl-CoA dehydrogenase [Sphingobium subterraneum]MBB6122683.1 alkylation response protein AidB-like acyl-CoA dehydrogenase [Sphingobium subterraneum]